MNPVFTELNFLKRLSSEIDERQRILLGQLTPKDLKPLVKHCGKIKAILAIRRWRPKWSLSHSKELIEWYYEREIKN